jgi:Zn-dependent protease with chaperone function
MSTRDEATFAQFTALMKRLETQARLDSVAYHGKILCFAVLGYALLLGLCVLTLGVLAGLVILTVLLLSKRVLFQGPMLYVGIPAAMCALLLCRVLGALLVRLVWSRIPPPQGLELRRGMAPRLFQALERLRASLETAPIHAVLINDEFNASVSQIPRLGLLGWHCNYLVIGLPLLHALSPDQLRAILAHELGHIAGQRSRVALCIHKSWVTWQQVEASLQGDGHLSARLLNTFCRWYMPRLYVYTFALQRADEYVADQLASRCTDAATTAESLICTTIKGRLLDTVIMPALRQQAQPFYSTMARHLNQEIPAGYCRQYLGEALAQATGYTDTHPCLAERLRLLGYYPDTPHGDPMTGKKALPLPTPLTETAATYYLGQTAAEATAFLDKLYVLQTAGGK